MIWTLIAVSAIYGLIGALVFLRFSNREKVRRSVNRIVAHLMELGLFLNSPAIAWRAQWDLVRENLRLLGLIVLPSVMVLVLFAAMYPLFDAMFGYAPLRTGDPVVVTARINDAGAVLEVPVGIEIETPAVHVIRDGEVSWRVRPLGRASGELKVHANGRTLTKRIVAGGGLIYEMHLPFTRASIDISYARTTVFGANWMVWFFGVSSLVAIFSRTIGYRR